MALKRKEIPSSSNHSSEEVLRALAAFSNQGRRTKSLERFSGSMLNWLLPDRSKDKDQASIFQQLGEIFDQVRCAREFNRGYLGHMLSHSSIPGFWGDVLASRLGDNTVASEVSIYTSDLEPKAMKQMLEIVGYDPNESSGTFTSGGTMANMTAFAVARKVMERKYEQENKDFPKEVWVLTTEMAHYSVPKSIDLLGGPGHTIKVVNIATEGMRMSVDALEEKVAEAKERGIPIMAIMAIAGETETGLVDDLDQIASIAQREGIYSHCDAAYGGPYVLSRNGEKFRGMNGFDSITIDAHKALYVPYSAGAVLFKNAEMHAELARGVRANYIQFEQELPRIVENLRNGKGSLGAKRIEGSMGAGPILSTLAVLETLGREGLAVVYDLTLDRIEHLYTRLCTSKLLVPYHEPDLNLLCFTLRDGPLKELGLTLDSELFHQFVTNNRLILDNQVRGAGGYYFSETDLPNEQTGKKEWVWRACIMNPWTTDRIVDEAVTNLEALISQSLRSNTGLITRR